MGELVTIATEPAGSTYRALLDFALSTESLFSLTWRTRTNYDPEAATIAAALEPDLVAESQSDRWPGTQLLQPDAVVRLYRLSPSAREVLASAEHLYAWQAPARPEDLAFYTPDRSVWLGSTAHEADSFLYPVATSVDDVVAKAGLTIDQ